MGHMHSRDTDHLTFILGFVVFSVLLYWYWICVDSSLLKWLFGTAWSWFLVAWCLHRLAQLCCLNHKYSLWLTRWSHRKCSSGGNGIGTLLCIGKYPLCLHKKYWSCCCLKPGSQIHWFIDLLIHSFNDSWTNQYKEFFLESAHLWNPFYMVF